METAAERLIEAGGISGLTVYYDENSYFLLGLRKTAQGADLVLKQLIGAEETDEALGQDGLAEFEHGTLTRCRGKPFLMETDGGKLLLTAWTETHP